MGARRAPARRTRLLGAFASKWTVSCQQRGSCQEDSVKSWVVAQQLFCVPQPSAALLFVCPLPAAASSVAGRAGPGGSRAASPLQKGFARGPGRAGEVPQPLGWWWQTAPSALDTDTWIEAARGELSWGVRREGARQRPEAVRTLSAALPAPQHQPEWSGLIQPRGKVVWGWRGACELCSGKLYASVLEATLLRYHS